MRVDDQHSLISSKQTTTICKSLLLKFTICSNSTQLFTHSIDLEDLARQQSLDPEFRALLRNAQTGLRFRRIKIGSVFLHVDVSIGPVRPFVPLSFRCRIFNVVHGLGHPGIERTRQSIADKFVWPNLRQDVSKWARECLPC